MQHAAAGETDHHDAVVALRSDSAATTLGGAVAAATPRRSRRPRSMSCSCRPVLRMRLPFSSIRNDEIWRRRKTLWRGGKGQCAFYICLLLWCII
jgi:hypothetical protein